ncbi:aldehyde dehydrogenase [Nocardia nova SH22a]|uniref:Aldehyde dehydrogenase n=1 Tax=Nocardia nova SH22a TaxID=1415166 RepID=W5TDT7_9NOCA|nr:aldehyde dehydrogenase family protein [Nocardia nova]AHH17505.1 aldehyde dehydrogenase [Nocardia nova SH22a]
MTVTTPIVTGQKVSPAVEAWLASHRPALLIDNEWVPAASGATFESVNPATEAVIGHVAEADKPDVDRAVRSARAAFENGPWAKMGPHARGAIMRRYGRILEEHADELTELESLDNGMTIGASKAFFTVAMESYYFFAGQTTVVGGHTPPVAEGAFNYTTRKPVGVVAGIIPWNAPITSAMWKVGPALAAGNAIILKPAEQASLSCIRLGELAVEAGFPPGVFNILTGFGPGAGSSLSEHPDVDKISFTGSTEVGKLILQASTGNLKRVTLELGGKSPNIVFADADLTAAVPYALAAFTTLTGQACGAGSRLFVQREIKDEFVELLTEQTAALTMGDPLDPATTLGPLASREQFDRVCGYLAAGKEAGATATIGGESVGGGGFFVQPTIFDGVDNSMRIAREEIFGPVLSVIPFTDEDDAIAQANDSTYGLGAAVWSRDISRAHRVADRIKSGMVWVNTYLALDPTMPLGGFKQSGIGREMGPDWYHHFTEEKAVYIKL